MLPCGAFRLVPIPVWSVSNYTNKTTIVHACTENNGRLYSKHILEHKTPIESFVTLEIRGKWRRLKSLFSHFPHQVPHLAGQRCERPAMPFASQSHAFAQLH